MPAISFSVFKGKLLSGEKCQTIRKPRKRPLKVGDVLHVFWKMRTKECEKLGVTKIVKIEHKSIYEMTKEDALKDGFQNRGELIDWVIGHYYYLCPMVHPTKRDTAPKFPIITFESLGVEE